MKLSRDSTGNATMPILFHPLIKPRVEFERFSWKQLNELRFGTERVPFAALRTQTAGYCWQLLKKCMYFLCIDGTNAECQIGQGLNSWWQVIVGSPSSPTCILPNKYLQSLKLFALRLFACVSAVATDLPPIYECFDCGTASKGIKRHQQTWPD